jgi:hypothetical protein
MITSSKHSSTGQIDLKLKESFTGWMIGLLLGLLVRQAPLTPCKYYLMKKHVKNIY